jgi:hypothetical protein
MVRPYDLPDILALQDEVYERFGDNVGSLAIEWLVNETRRQIGRELLSEEMYNMDLGDNVILSKHVREVCQLGDSDE